MSQHGTLPSNRATASENPLSPTRQLAAFMFSDVCGYTAIMGRDEHKAIEVLAEHRHLLRGLIPKFTGKKLNEAGDGVLMSFQSAVDAVNCAREIQARRVEDPDLRVRIGIHIGDAVFAEGGAFGDGVNVASRIHALAAPGGICISERVYDEIRPDESIAEARKALEADPLSVPVNNALGEMLIDAHRFDEAIAQFRKTLEMDPNTNYVHETS